ncbi:MAG: site-specific integrase [Bacteroidales bacterium]|nr:site-specific integrase [Bacteroidales bacterium]
MSCKDKKNDFQVRSSRPHSGNGLKINSLPEFSSETGSDPGHIFSLDDILEAAFGESAKEKKMFLFKPLPGIDYRAPKLTRGNPDWVIRYYAKDPATGKLRRIRIKVNHIKPVKERLRAAREIMAAIEERLALGWNPLRDATAAKSSTPAFAAYNTFLAVKTKEAEVQSISSYRSYIKVFSQWLRDAGFDEVRPICCVTKETALAFLNHLDEKEDISARTWNNYLSFLQTLHTWLKEKGYMSSNPFDGIKRKPKRLTAKKRRTFTDDELSRLFAWLQENNREFLAVCLLCYACFIRPKEIALLRCRDIDLHAQTVHVRGEIAKNDNDSYRTIPDAVLPALRRLDLSHPDWALFGKNYGVGDDFRPGPDPADQRKFAGYWAYQIRPALGFPEELQLYSLKDTGITNMATAGVAINLVQQQADHSNVAITSIYLGKKPEANAKIRGAAILPGSASDDAEIREVVGDSKSV